MYENKTSPDLSIAKRLGGTNDAKLLLLLVNTKFIRYFCFRAKI